MNDSEKTVIKPPLKRATSGKTFTPSSKFRNKLLTLAVSAAIALWALVILSWMGIAYMVSTDPSENINYALYMQQWFIPANLYFWIFNLIWLIPAVIAIPLYVNSIEYSVMSESGEATPEIYVKKGIVNITRKHVPFRTITNISSRVGPIDRLFNIGNIEIQTAGFSGPKSSGGPEEKIEGIVFYEELRDYILHELRKLKAPYTTGTEVVTRETEPLEELKGTRQQEMILLLREIRDSVAPIKQLVEKLE
ncbi:MAG: PH domain-containing protein [Candidatus Lokiarchaeota archaeon]|nr:PH domain-containing protein [Candidatus Lokiarchaeota archaeon]